jgi:hypothetical protein
MVQQSLFLGCVWWGIAMVAFEINLPQSVYLAQQAVELSLRITNSGDVPVELPDPDDLMSSQPVYGLAGPGNPKPVLFSKWSKYGRGRPTPPDAKLLTIAPGETWEGSVPLQRLTPVEIEGEYRVAAALSWKGLNVRAKDIAFQLARPIPISIHVGQGARPFDQALGQIVFLQPEQEAKGVYSIRFQESDPSNSEVALDPTRRRATAGAGATDVMSPWRNTPFFDEMLQWTVWREGRSIKALSSVEKVPATIDLPAEPDFLVHPALKTKDGPVEILAVKGKTISLITAPPRPKSQPAIAWHADLPAMPGLMTSALGPVAKGSPRHIAFVVKGSKGIEVRHGSYTPGGLGRFQTAHVDGGVLLDGVPLELTVTGDGVAHVAVVQSRDAGKALSLAEIQFGDGGPKVTVRPLPPLEEPAVGGVIHYVTVNGAITRTDIVVSSHGDLWNIGASGAFQKIEPRRAFVSPLTMVPGLELSYLLYQTATGSFEFVPLNR